MDNLYIVRNKIQFLTINTRKVRCRDRILNTEFLKQWYLIVISKQISYRNEAWFNNLKISVLKRFSLYQRLELLPIIKAHRSNSTDALCVITGVSPIRYTLCHGMRKYSILHSNGSVTIDRLVINKDIIKRKQHTFDFLS